MRIFHTSDWHLGQSFFGYDRTKEHVLYLKWLMNFVKENKIDLLLISGDVFDSSNPSAESQSIYYSFLHKITQQNPNLQIIIIAGNHDSAARLEAPNPLLQEMNVFVRGSIKKDENKNIKLDDLIIPIKINNKVEAVCLAVPFIRQGDYPPSNSYSDGVEKLFDLLYNKSLVYNKPIIAMGHLYANQASLSDDDRSERILIGGIDSVGFNTFNPGIVYTALGHLHRPQKVFRRDNVRYAGSPIHMSFAEKNYDHGGVFVEIINSNKININQIKYSPAVEMISIVAKSVDEAVEKINNIPNYKNITDKDFLPFLEVKIHITQPEPLLANRIKDSLENKNIRLTKIESILPKNNNRLNNNKILTLDGFNSLSPMKIASDVYNKKYNSVMPSGIKKMLEQVINKIKLDNN